MRLALTEKCEMLLLLTRTAWGFLKQKNHFAYSAEKKCECEEYKILTED
jgi:hypothetical protein